MPTIPVYRAEEGLDTAATTMPEIGRLDAAAVAMQNVGQSISQLGSHMMARAKQKEGTDAAFLYNEEVMKAQETTNQTIDNNDTDDGSGMTDTGVTAIKTSNNEALNQIRDPELRKQYAQKFDHLQRRHALHLSNVEDTKRTGYYTTKSEEYAGNRALHLRETPDDYETLKKENEAEIDGMPITPAVKKSLKASTNKILLDGKADGDYKKDPAGLKKKLGVVKSRGTSSGEIPGGKDTNQLRSKQLAFVWHEFTGDANAGMGGSSEAGAYNRLKKATTLVDAVKAGFSYERPKVWNVDARLRYARQVFTGNAPAAAMQARQYFESKGLSPIQASGMVGVLMGESGSNLNPRIPGDAGISIGIGQWNDGEGKDGKPRGTPRKSNMLKFVKSGDTEGGPGGTFVPGTTPSKGGRYSAATETVSAEVDSEYASMPYEWRKARANKVDADLIQQQNDEYIAASAKTEQVAKDAIASIQANGDMEGIVEPTLKDFIMANKGDEDKGIDSWMKYQTTKDAALLAHKFKGMSRWEIDDALEQYRVNIPAGEGAALGEALYANLQGAAKVAAGPKEAEEKFAEHMKNMWTKAQADVDKDRLTDEKLDLSIKNSWLAMQLEWNAQEAIRAQRQYTAAESAAKSELAARQDHPWDYVMGGTPGDRNDLKAVRQAWSTVAANPPNVPGYESMTAVAIDTTYQAQKHLGTFEENMQLIDPRSVQHIIGILNNDTSEMSMDQKMKSLTSVFALTPNQHYRSILFNQFEKAGLPTEMRFVLEAWERGDTGATSMLFFPALSKNLKPVDDIKMSKYKEEADKQVNSLLGQAEFGNGVMDPRSVKNLAAASKLITNFSIMMGGDPADSAATAFSMMVGPKHHVDARLGYGTKVNVSANNNVDDDKLTTGFNNLTADVEMAYIAVIPDRKDQVARARIHQGVQAGEFVNYEDGYAFRVPSGRLLQDPNTGENMKWTSDDVLAAAERVDNRVPEKVLKGWGLLPQDMMMPEGPMLDIDKVPPLKVPYSPDTSDKFYKIYGGR